MGKETRINIDVNTQQEIAEIEKRMVRYRDLLAVPAVENGQSFVGLNQYGIANGYQPEMADMLEITGPEVFVREEVAQRLVSAQAFLQSTNPDYALFVTYGYRSLEVQTKKFMQQLQTETQAGKFFPDPIDLYEEAHRFIAVPTVAGHPTGGAVDVTIRDKRTNESIDFGGPQYDFANKDCYVFYPGISDNGRKNRTLLRRVMKQSGFAPFDGEWWHFSYGDKEWAYYYKKPNALYTQKAMTDLGTKR